MEVIRRAAVDANSFFGAVLGLAYPPDGAPNWPPNTTPADERVQGVVVHYEVFGKPNPFAIGDFSIADQGRTVIHEIGHYLGLRHIWGDGQSSIFGIPDCSADDGIDDTPNSGSNSQGSCDASKNTCDDGANDLPDLWESYMDYAEERCQSLFTVQQAAIMRASILNFRPGLLEPKCLDSVAVSVKEKLDGNLFTIYPNPTKNQLQIQFKKAVNSFDVKIYDALGGVVFEQKFENANSSEPIFLNLENLPFGIYHLQLFNQAINSNTKIIKTH